MLPDVAFSSTGAPGTVELLAEARGVTLTEADAALVPTELLAVTVQV